MTLYELTKQYQDVSDMLYNEADEQTILDTLEGLEGEIEEKAEGYAKIIRNIEGDMAALKEEETRLKKRRGGLENKVKYLKGCLENAMRKTGKQKITTKLFTIGIWKNPQHVEVLDERKALDCGYATEITKLDIASLKEALKKGEQYDFARLVQDESLHIR